jgi:hypothetical protein
MHINDDLFMGTWEHFKVKGDLHHGINTLVGFLLLGEDPSK